MLELFKILFVIPFLLYSCYSDLRTRRVSNRVWLVMLAIGIQFTLYDLSVYRLPYLYVLAFSAGFIFVFVYLLFEFGAFGGADAKVLIVLSIIIPAYPVLDIWGYSLPVAGKPLIDIFAFSIFGNAVLLTIVVPMFLLIYNLTHLTISKVGNPAYLHVGYMCDISELKGKHVKLMHQYERAEGGVLLTFRRSGVVVTDEVHAELLKLRDEGLIGRKVWVTPGLPFMIPITLGFFVAIVYGDLIYLITRAFLTG
ncbi:MAG TPA: peptidase A24 [Candidatus Methanoperedenaceae archaeon]|nr:peptidase A24 [Candidatus Methanoperedenaceae archaeon]